MAWLSYDLGRVFEPTARARAGEPSAADDARWPLAEFARCPGAYVHDGATGRWWSVGDRSALPELTPRAAVRGAEPPTLVSPLRSLSGREGFCAGVARAVELVRAGDVFQANLAHALEATLAGADPRRLARRLLGHSGAWFGGYFEHRDERGPLRHALASASPELFLSLDPRTGRITTRPIKGTIDASAPDAGARLRQSAKDQAELTMITDLMRNDLGRVCELGSVRVDEVRAIEAHGGRPGVLHGVATVSGQMRTGASLGEILAATFPPGSVTGAPKVRAMQIIDALEPVRRGPYCGAMGFVSACHSSAWNVAIRTAMLTPGASSGELELRYPVGAGIVAESVPELEWEETLHKAGVLRRALGVDAPGRGPAPGPAPRRALRARA